MVVIRVILSHHRSGYRPSAGLAGDSDRLRAVGALGCNLGIVGLGLLLRSLMNVNQVRPDTSDRVAYTFIGVLVLVYWFIPFSTLEGVFGELNGGIEMFFISGVTMVAAAVWTVMYNADLLLKILTALTARIGSLRPVLVTAVAYPMSAKFRTG